MRRRLPLFLFLVFGYAFSADGQTSAQNFALDRYEFQADRMNQVRAGISNDEIRFNGINILISGAADGIVIEALSIRSNGGDADFWITRDSSLFFSVKNPQTALIRRMGPNHQIILHRDVVPGELLNLFLNFRLQPRYDKSDSGLIRDLFSVEVFHSGSPDRIIRMQPAQTITVRR